MKTEAENARWTEVIRFLPLLTLPLISAFSSDLDRKALRKNAWKKSGYVSRKYKREFKYAWEYSENTFSAKADVGLLWERDIHAYDVKIKYTELYSDISRRLRIYEFSIRNKVFHFIKNNQALYFLNPLRKAQESHINFLSIQYATFFYYII